ncbi:MAG: hypothetical protein HZB31_04380 [Nitrospirae bacterium]|nr:hypothetical protein [Nitrospirota bacterium]
MAVSIINGNVLEAQADALILTIDGARKGMEGNIARQFSRKWPEVWAELEDEISYPLPLGQVFDYEPVSECPFKLLLIASTLVHMGNLTEYYLKGIVRTAFEEALTRAAEYNVSKVASAVMSGGWRLKPQAAFLSMTDGYESATRNGSKIGIEIYLPDQQQYLHIKALAESMGWR